MQALLDAGGKVGKGKANDGWIQLIQPPFHTVPSQGFLDSE